MQTSYKMLSLVSLINSYQCYKKLYFIYYITDSNTYSKGDDLIENRNKKAFMPTT